MSKFYSIRKRFDLDKNLKMEYLDLLKTNKLFQQKISQQIEKYEEPGGYLTKLSGKFERLWMIHSPLARQTTSLQKSYDPSIASFFVLIRFLTLLSILTCMIYSYLLINHLFTKGLDFNKKCINGKLNCFLLYSSFDPDDTLAYILTIGISIISCSTLSLY